MEMRLLIELDKLRNEHIRESSDISEIWRYCKKGSKLQVKQWEKDREIRQRVEEERLKVKKDFKKLGLEEEQIVGQIESSKVC